MDYSVISIGALSKHPFWNETEPRRVPHATTTLIRDGEVTLLVDPSLPPEMLAARLDERTGLTPEQIDAVFLTTFRPVHRRSLELFPDARWLMHEPEIDAVGRHLGEIEARAEPGDDVLELVNDERRLLQKIEPAEDRITSQIHLYPAIGASPGSSGLLLAIPTRTVLVAGDAVLTQAHFQAGRVFEQAANVERARDSFADIVGVADEIVPGHDNLFAVPGR